MRPNCQLRQGGQFRYSQGKGHRSEGLGRAGTGQQERCEVQQGQTQSFTEKGMEILVDSMQNISQQCILTAKKAQYWAVWAGAPPEGWGKWLFPLVLRPHPENCTQLWPPVWERRGQTILGSAEDHQDGQELEHLPYEEKLRKLGFFNLEKRKLQADLIAAFHYLQGCRSSKRWS